MIPGPTAEQRPRVRTGAERLLSDASDLILRKRIGILTNRTGILPDGTSIIDAICRRKLAKVSAIFSPEHGLGGNVPDGSPVESVRHPVYRIPVHSLYGSTHKPTPEMLEDLDLLVCDLQDVGVRFYTYISTLALVLEAAAEQHLPCLVLDRPNPNRGLHVDGPVREEPLKSFVGWMPIPVLYGMTLGELMRLFNEEGWFANGVRASLDVIAMEGWSRSMWYDETALPWIPPSPNMPRIDTAVLYPGLCFFEGTSASEGRGTDDPFMLTGAPWADPERILHHLTGLDTRGIRAEPAEFTPREIPGVALNPKHIGETCRGLRLTLTDRDIVRPVRLGIALLSAYKRAHPDRMELRNRRFDILTGSRHVRELLEEGAPPDEIAGSWEAGLRTFARLRDRYLLYSP